MGGPEFNVVKKSMYEKEVRQPTLKFSNDVFTPKQREKETTKDTAAMRRLKLVNAMPQAIGFLPRAVAKSMIGTARERVQPLLERNRQVIDAQAQAAARAWDEAERTSESLSVLRTARAKSLEKIRELSETGDKLDPFRLGVAIGAELSDLQELTLNPALRADAIPSLKAAIDAEQTYLKTLRDITGIIPDARLVTDRRTPSRRELDKKISIASRVTFMAAAGGMAVLTGLITALGNKNRLDPRSYTATAIWMLPFLAAWKGKSLLQGRDEKFLSDIQFLGTSKFEQALKGMPTEKRSAFATFVENRIFQRDRELQTVLSGKATPEQQREFLTGVPVEIRSEVESMLKDGTLKAVVSQLGAARSKESRAFTLEYLKKGRPPDLQVLKEASAP